MKRKTERMTDKRTITEAIAYIHLTTMTASRVKIVNTDDGISFVRYETSVPSEANGGKRLFIYDHRSKSVSSAKKYKNHGRNRSARRKKNPASIPSIGKVSIVEEKGSYRINIYDITKEVMFPQTVLKEIYERNSDGCLFSVSGDPIWGLVLNGPEALIAVTLESTIDHSKSLSFDVRKSRNQKIG